MVTNGSGPGRTCKAIQNWYLQIKIANCISETANHDEIWCYLTITVQTQMKQSNQIIRVFLL